MFSSAARHAHLADYLPNTRACDECRARKLACSKELRGCTRCSKEGIPCCYSARRQMGRPRERGFFGHIRHAPKTSTIGTEPTSVVSQLVDNANNKWSFVPTDETFASSIANCHASIPDLPLHNFSDTNGANVYDIHPLPQQRQCQNDNSEILLSSGGRTQQATGVIDQLALNWTSSSGMPPATIQCSLHGAMASRMGLSQVAAQQAPSNTIQTQPECEQSKLTSRDTTSCSCLSSLFLALQSLSRLPVDSTSAICVVRDASMAAHRVIECSKCINSANAPLNTVNPKRMQLFQNMMLLGVLLPSICNAYASIIDKIDRETNKATIEDTDIFLGKENYELWRSSLRSSASFSMMQRSRNTYVEPGVWRIVMRGILRLDINGLVEYSGNDDGALNPQRQMSLKDVVEHLDNISRRRHEIIDQLIAEKKLPASAHNIVPGLGQSLCPSNQRVCALTIAKARMILNRLGLALGSDTLSRG